MARIFVWSICITVILVSCTGCISLLMMTLTGSPDSISKVDVSSQIEMWGGFEPEATYELIEDSRIMLSGDISPLEQINTRSCSVDECRSDVSKGTLIRATRAVLVSYLNDRGKGHGRVEVMGEILSGPFTGKEVGFTGCGKPSALKPLRVNDLKILRWDPDTDVLRKTDSGPLGPK